MKSGTGAGSSLQGCWSQCILLMLKDSFQASVMSELQQLVFLSWRGLVLTSSSSELESELTSIAMKVFTNKEFVLVFWCMTRLNISIDVWKLLHLLKWLFYQIENYIFDIEIDILCIFYNYILYILGRGIIYDYVMCIYLHWNGLRIHTLPFLAIFRWEITNSSDSDVRWLCINLPSPSASSEKLDKLANISKTPWLMRRAQVFRLALNPTILSANLNVSAILPCIVRFKSFKAMKMSLK